jgi:ribosome-binding ATPase YchF (GTP1/OBG family)
MQVGLVGTEASGKTTLFELLSHAHGAFLSPDKANTAAVDVPDERLERLAALYQPKKTTPAKIFFTDTNRLAAGERANNNKSLNHLKLMDTLTVVVNGFRPGCAGAQMQSDLEFCLSEMMLSDMEQVENKLKRLGKQPKASALGGMPETEIFQKLSEALEANRFLSTVDLPPEVWKELLSFSFLTVKPMFAVANLSEEHGNDGPPGLTEFEQAAAGRGLPVVRVYAKLEKDLQELAPEDRAVFITEYPFPLDSRNHFIRQAYHTAGLISFLTAGEDEVRAWTVRRDCPVQEAAGVIHNDLMNFFVRAEVVTYEHLLQAGSEAEAARRGWLRSEKKEYPVQDGDVLHILASK